MSKEILAVVESVSNEKGVDAGIVLEAIERRSRARRSAVTLPISTSRCPSTVDTGEYTTHRRWQVVPDDDEDVPVDDEEEPFQFDPNDTPG